MTHLEISLIIGMLVQFTAIYFLVKGNRDLTTENKECRDAVDTMSLDLINARKNVKLSSDVLEVLNDLKTGGTILHVERIDRNDVFFHQGGQYR